MLRHSNHSNQEAEESLVLGEPSSGDLDDEDETEPLSPRASAGHYSDKFIDVNPETKTLTLHNYLFLKPTRHILIPDILYITPASEMSWIGAKIEGLSMTGILWARDWSRGLLGSNRKNSYVVKIKGDILRIGFSVEHPAKFMRALEYLHPSITSRKELEDEGVNADAGAVAESM